MEAIKKIRQKDNVTLHPIEIKVKKEWGQKRAEERQKEEIEMTLKKKKDQEDAKKKPVLKNVKRIMIRSEKNPVQQEERKKEKEADEIARFKFLGVYQLEELQEQDGARK